MGLDQYLFKISRLPGYWQDKFKECKTEDDINDLASSLDPNICVNAYDAHDDTSLIDAIKYLACFVEIDGCEYYIYKEEQIMYLRKDYRFSDLMHNIYSKEHDYFDELKNCEYFPVPEKYFDEIKKYSDEWCPWIDLPLTEDSLRTDEENTAIVYYEWY